MHLLDRVGVHFLALAASDCEMRSYPIVNKLLLGCPIYLQAEIPNYDLLVSELNDKTPSPCPASWEPSTSRSQSAPTIANLVELMLCRPAGCNTLDTLELAVQFVSYKVMVRGFAFSVVDFEQAERITGLLELILDSTEDS